MNRRHFMQLVSLAGASCALLPLVGCGAAADGGVSRVMAGTTRKVVVYDLVMEGWSTLGSGRLGENGILLATQIVGFQAITLPYVQDNHGHKFTLTQAEFAQLLLGQDVSVLTTYALGQRHEVRVLPANRARNGSQPLSVEIDENGHPVG